MLFKESWREQSSWVIFHMQRSMENHLDESDKRAFAQILNESGLADIFEGKQILGEALIVTMNELLETLPQELVAQTLAKNITKIAKNGVF